MNKRIKVLTINGIRGLITAVFIVCCLFAGFIISPAWVLMTIWNYAANNYFTIPQINIFQGLMLWALIALVLYALNNKRTLVSFGAYPAFSQEEFQSFIKKAHISNPDVIKDLEKIQKAVNDDIAAEKLENKNNNTGEN